MEKLKKIYLNIEADKLQVFFAVLAYVEKFKNNKIFLFDDKNINLLEECEYYFNFQKLERRDHKYDYNTINITVNHKLPITKIENLFSAPLIFPKLINSRFHTHIDKKINKIYFRGLLTKLRVVKCIQLFIEIKDFEAIKLFFMQILKFGSDFEIKTDKVFMKFTRRGRQKKYKYLDEEYYLEMSRYKYIFCPRGVFTWTYRFFEAVQVGSIPISKYSIPEYLDFFYLTTKTNETITQEQDEASQNYLAFKEKYHL